MHLGQHSSVFFKSHARTIIHEFGYGLIIGIGIPVLEPEIASQTVIHRGHEVVRDVDIGFVYRRLIRAAGANRRVDRFINRDTRNTKFVVLQAVALPFKFHKIGVVRRW